MTEQEVIDTIVAVAKKVAPKFEFPGYTREDLEQEAFIIAIDGLERYKPDRPLANFLFIHIKNRLGHVKRKHYIRIDKPCLNCPVGAYVKPDGCSAFQNKQDCELWAKWTARNEKKKNLARPLDIGEYECAVDNNLPEDNFNKKELVKLLDREISIENRPAWLKIKAGSKISKKDREKLQEDILFIFSENNIDGFETW